MSGYPPCPPYTEEPYGQPYGGQYGQPYGGQYGQPHEGQYGQPCAGQYNQPHGGRYNQPLGVQYGQSCGGPTIVTTQPNVVVVNPHSPAPNSYMTLAIFSCLCCVWPIGLAAVFFSSMSSDAARAGDLEGAASKGKVSLGLSITSIVLGLTVVIVIVSLYASGYFFYTTYYDI